MYQLELLQYASNSSNLVSNQHFRVEVDPTAHLVP